MTSDILSRMERLEQDVAAMREKLAVSIAELSHHVKLCERRSARIERWLMLTAGGLFSYILAHVNWAGLVSRLGE